MGNSQSRDSYTWPKTPASPPRYASVLHPSVGPYHVNSPVCRLISTSVEYTILCSSHGVTSVHVVCSPLLLQAQCCPTLIKQSLTSIPAYLKGSQLFNEFLFMIAGHDPQSCIARYTAIRISLAAQRTNECGACTAESAVQ